MAVSLYLPPPWGSGRCEDGTEPKVPLFRGVDSITRQIVTSRATSRPAARLHGLPLRDVGTGLARAGMALETRLPFH